VGLLLAAALLTHATEPIRLADGLARLFGFLERARIPVKDLVLVLTLAMRFLPTVLEEAQRIVLAQRARGAAFGGGALARARRLLPLAVPLFAACLHRADRLALAMEARGFQGAAARTQLEPLAFRPADAWTLLGTTLMLAALPWLAR
jgi:energy-coupling factor transport system permease protein